MQEQIPIPKRNPDKKPQGFALHLFSQFFGFFV
jgi:hypothetical protein